MHHVRLTDDTAERVKRTAETERRTVPQMVEILLAEAFAERRGGQRPLSYPKPARGRKRG